MDGTEEKRGLRRIEQRGGLGKDEDEEGRVKQVENVVRVENAIPQTRAADGIQSSGVEKDARRIDTRMQGDGKRKSNRYGCTLAKADGRGPTRFGRRMRNFRFGGIVGSQQRLGERIRDESKQRGAARTRNEVGGGQGSKSRRGAALWRCKSPKAQPN